MVTLSMLWLPILVATVLVYIASSVIWMALPYHRSDTRRLPDEGPVLEPLQKQDLKPFQAFGTLNLEGHPGHFFALPVHDLVIQQREIFNFSDIRQYFFVSADKRSGDLDPIGAYDLPGFGCSETGNKVHDRIG